MPGVTPFTDTTGFALACVTVMGMSTWLTYVPPPAGPDRTRTVAWPLTALALAVKVTVKSSPQAVIDKGSGLAVTPSGVTTSSLSGFSPASMLQPGSGSPAALLPTTRIVALPLVDDPATSATPVPESSMESCNVSAKSKPATDHDQRRCRRDYSDCLACTTHEVS